jgi:thiamine pyrophosphokinase
LKWPLQDAHWERGLFGISNVVDADSVFIHALMGRFLVILPL